MPSRVSATPSALPHWQPLGRIPLVHPALSGRVSPLSCSSPLPPLVPLPRNLPNATRKAIRVNISSPRRCRNRLVDWVVINPLINYRGYVTRRACATRECDTRDDSWYSRGGTCFTSFAASRFRGNVRILNADGILRLIPFTRVPTTIKVIRCRNVHAAWQIRARAGRE